MIFRNLTFCAAAALLISAVALHSQTTTVTGFETDPTDFDNAIGAAAGRYDSVSGTQGAGIMYGFDLATTHDWWPSVGGDWELDTISIKLALGSQNTQNVTVSIWSGGVNGFGDPYPTAYLGDATPDTLSVTGGGAVNEYTFTLDVTGSLRTNLSPFSGSGTTDYIWISIQGSDTSAGGVLSAQMTDPGTSIPDWASNAFATGWSPSAIVWKGAANTASGSFTDNGSSYTASGLVAMGHVKLNYVTVPEPSGLLYLSAVGAIAMMRRHGRKVA